MSVTNFFVLANNDNNQTVRSLNLRRSYQLGLELHYIYFKRRAAFTLRLKQISFTFVNNANMLVIVGVR